MSNHKNIVHKRAKGGLAKTGFQYLVLIACVAYVYKTLAVDNDLPTLIRAVQVEWDIISLLPLIVAVIMVIPNWFLEARKWQLAMRPEMLTFQKSLASILSGVAAGLFTPARVGEYFGRMFPLDKNIRGHSIIATFRCSLAQSVVTMSLGVMALSLYVNTAILFVDGLGHSLLQIFGISAMIFALVVYLNIHNITGQLSRISWISKYGIPLGTRNSMRSQLQLLGLAMLRYAVYLIQYVLVLLFCGIALPFVDMMIHVALVFFIQSMVPLPPIAHLFARTGVATAVFSYMGNYELVIVLSSLMIWVINLLFPALCGLGIIMTHNEYDEQKSTL